MPLLARPARRGLDRLSAADRSRALHLIGSLDGNPTLGKRLQGRWSGSRSVRFDQFRIIHRQTTDGVVVVLRVAPRGEAYRP